MHLPLDIYTLIGRYVGILLPLAIAQQRDEPRQREDILYRSSRERTNIPGHLGTQFALRATMHAARVPRWGTSIYFPPRTARGERGSRIKGLPSLSFRTHIKAISPRLPFSTGNRTRKSIYMYKRRWETGRYLPSERDSNICREYEYKVWMWRILRRRDVNYGVLKLPSSLSLSHVANNFFSFICI